MILAAGRGMRMRPLTDRTPKPLLEVKGKALIDYHLEALASAGITEVVINIHYLGELIEAHVGRGEYFGVRVEYSREETLLETAGGIRRAMPKLGADPFIVVSGDIFTDYDFARLPEVLPDQLAHLVMVDNPPHHQDGDFTLHRDGRVRSQAGASLTYAGIGVYSPAFFEEVPDDGSPFKLRTLFDAALSAGR
ncbi:MAG: nucleotidyltransferase family protein [Gammaproteobacteria bacterium]|nr:nucleotidyltransferase family protein [Gammaproteobacteria bacterium]